MCQLGAKLFWFSKLSTVANCVHGIGKVAYYESGDLPLSIGNTIPVILVIFVKIVTWSNVAHSLKKLTNRPKWSTDFISKTAKYMVINPY